MNSRTLAVSTFEQTLAEREQFDALDDRANAATVDMLQAAADLAERQPARFFGLEPTPREVFLSQRLVKLADDVTRSDQLDLAGDGTGAAADGDITGNIGPIGPAIARAAPFLLPLLFEYGLSLLGGGGAKDADQAGGGQKVDRQLDDGFGFIAEEKQYIMGLTEMVNAKLGRPAGASTDG